jgi:hypothetical protein
MQGTTLGGCAPWVIEVANRGEDTRGEVLIQSEVMTIRHPVELPRGSKKRFLSYVPEYSYYANLTISLRTNVGVVTFPMPPAEQSYSQYVCLVGGNSGEMTFIRTQSTAEYGDRLRDVYGKPGTLPDRPIGYSACSVVVLGEGAERMTDAEVDALKGWVVSGGTLVFLGGASSPVLDDARWRAFLPVGPRRRANVARLPGIERLAGSSAPAGTFSINYGPPSAGASTTFAAEGRDLIVEKRVGLGSVAYMAFDPFQPPLKQWKGLYKLFSNGLDTGRIVERRMYVFRQMGSTQEANYYPGADVIDSPFDVKLPSTGVVLLILVAHLVVAVPLNFLVMRKLGKGELAWITTPIISVIFAALFFRLASGLYEAGQSTRSHGILLASSLHPTGFFKGSTELFIPRGGVYDLRLQNTETVSPIGTDYYYDQNARSLQVVDDGMVRIPELRVSNLAFEEFQVSQLVPSDVLRLNATRQGTNKLKIEVENRSAFSLEGASVHYLDKTYAVGRVEAGKTFSTVATGTPLTDAQFADCKVLVLTSPILGFKPSVQMGADVGSNIQLIFVGEAPK